MRWVTIKRYVISSGSLHRFRGDCISAVVRGTADTSVEIEAWRQIKVCFVPLCVHFMDTIIKLPRHNGTTCCACVCVCCVWSEKETDKISHNIMSSCLQEVWLVLIRYAPCSSKWSFILKASPSRLAACCCCCFKNTLCNSRQPLSEADLARRPTITSTIQNGWSAGTRRVSLGPVESRCSGTRTKSSQIISECEKKSNV